MRVHELAKEFNISNTDLIKELKSLKINVKGHMSSLDESDVESIRKKLAKPSATQKAQKPAKPVKAPRVTAKPKKVKVQKIIEKAIEKQPVKKEEEDRSKEKPKEKPKGARAEKAKEVQIEKTKEFRSEKPKEVQVEKPKETQAQESVAGLKEIQVIFPLTVKDISVKLQQKTSIVIKKLMELRIFATINQNLTEDIAEKLAISFGYALKKLPTEEQAIIQSHEREDDLSKLKPRPPVVTFMGHVDHGKTSLLDYIRSSTIAEKEHGGITQHIGAYKVILKKGQITFLDTPGHEAFTAMRARGANITDIVVLVVAADEGVMPQTIEAIDHAKAAGVPIVAAMNKIDKQNADIDKVKRQLNDLGLVPEDWGGKTICVGVSAKTGEGVDLLLEMMLLEAEMLELKANADRKATGVIVEAKLTKGKGPIATAIIQNGTLRQADVIIVGKHYGRIRALLDDHERLIESAGPAEPVEILGLSGVPEAGEQFYVMDDEKKARDICEKRLEQKRLTQATQATHITLDDLYAKIKEGQIKELNIILKADVQGSLEALRDSLNKLPTNEVKLNTIHSGIGAVSASDVILAAASDAVVIGFNVDIATTAKEQIEKEGVDVRTYRIIYDALNEIKAALEGLLEPKIKKKFMGRIEIRQVFKLSKSGTIAGCFVQKGRVTRSADATLMRNGEPVYEGKISSLKRFKDDVREVQEGFECGIALANFDQYMSGDIIETFEIEKIARKL